VDTFDFLTAQNLMTLLIVLAIAVFLLVRVRRSQRRRGELGDGRGVHHRDTGARQPPR
jgi:hypothetical protein